MATTVSLTRTQATKVAQMAHDGIARKVYPAHTLFDGDTLFCIAPGTLDSPAGLMAVDAIATAGSESIVRAVRKAESIFTETPR